jgi:hypothetical protein
MSDGADNFVTTMAHFINAVKSGNDAALWRLLSSKGFERALKWWYEYDRKSYIEFCEKVTQAQEVKDDE